MSKKNCDSMECGHYSCWDVNQLNEQLKDKEEEIKMHSDLRRDNLDVHIECERNRIAEIGKLHDQLKDKDAEIELLKKDIFIMPPIEVEKRMKQELELATDYISRIEKDIKDKDAEIASQNRKIEWLQDQVKDKDARIAELDQDRNYWKKSADDYSFINREMNAQLKSARDNALEDAAVKAETELVASGGSGILEASGMLIATAIRSLKTKGQV
jgi:chromosome segregation ATPase